MQVSKENGFEPEPD